MRFLHTIRQSLHGLLTEPLEELTRAQRSLRYVLDFGRYCALELRADRAGEMAAALTYHTLFSLLPTIVLMLVVMQTFVGEAERETLKQNVVDFALQWITPEENPDAGQLQTDPTVVNEEAGAGASADEATQSPGEPEIAGLPGDPADTDDFDDPDDKLADIRAQMTQNVQGWIAKLEQINFASIGIVGVLLFLYATTKLLTTIEHSFNRIFDAPFGRPLYVRLPLYYTSITFAPLLLLAGQYLQRLVIRGIEQAAQATGQSVGWLGELTALLTPFITTWLLLLMMYRFLPNTRVSSRAAAIGGFVSALGWIASVEFFKIYVNQQGTANVYGALALVPLFLLWLWVTWLIVLFGVEVTYTIQAMKGRRFKSLRTSEDRDVLFDPRWMIPLVAMIGHAFERGKPIRLNELQSETGLPNRAVASLIDMLTRANVIHHVEHGEPGVPAYTLARPPERIGVDELLDLSEKSAMRERSRSKLTGTDVVARLHTAQLNAAKGTTLADVMGQEAD